MVELHERILTEKEREAIKEYLKSGQGSGFIYTLRHRARKFLPIFKGEIALMEEFLAHQ